MKRIIRLLAAAIVLAVTGVAQAQDVKPAAAKPARPAIYDEKADAKGQVKAATALARRDARRVLVMFGYNGCGWCHLLHGLFKSDDSVRGVLADEYVVSMVDIQAPNAQALMDRAKDALPADERDRVGFPFLAVLDGDGGVVTAQRTDPLEKGNGHDAGKVKAFLEKWAAKADAAKVFGEGLAKASGEGKLVFLHFGAPTCGWCHKLDAFLAREDVAPVLGREFVDVKLDLARMSGAEGVLKRYNPGASGGIPWFAFVDGNGKALATSDGPNGNIGYPASPEEIAHFVGMLRKTASKLGPGEIDRIEAALKAEGKKIETARTSASN